MKVVVDFKSLKLTEMAEAYPLITEAFNQAKERRRQELETEIRGWGFKPGETPKKPVQAAYKYVSKKDPSKGWSGRGAVAAFLKAEMEETGLPLEAFRVS